MKRNCVRRYAFGAAVVMMLTPAIAKAQSNQGLNLIITGNRQSGFQFVESTDTFVNGKGDKIIMGYTAFTGQAAKGDSSYPSYPQQQKVPLTTSSQSNTDSEYPASEAKKKIKEEEENIPENPQPQNAVQSVQIPPAEPLSTENQTTEEDRSDGIYHDSYDPTRLQKIEDNSFNTAEKEDEGADEQTDDGHLIGAVSSNAIYDLLLAPNIGIDIPFGIDKKWSVGAEGWIRWMHHSSTDDFSETYGFGMNVRRWLSEGDPLSGWFAGIYAKTFTYDYMNGEKGYQSPSLFDTFSIGAETGYSKRLTDNWFLSAYLGTGVLHTNQKVYRNNFGSGYYITRERVRNMLDFTHFGISINYIFK